MCYDIKVSLERQLKMAKHYGDVNAIIEIEKKLLPLLNPIEREYHQVSGFQHPALFVLKQNEVVLASWGLIPEWVSDVEKANKIQEVTLNAKGETLLDKPSFEKAVRNDRCVLFIDGFYEHQHRFKKTYPYYIFRANEDLMPIAAISSVWKDPITGIKKSTFSIVTTKANDLLKEIHNNPKLDEPRMPLILKESEIHNWINETVDIQQLLIDLVRPFPENKLHAHTVRKIGKKAEHDNENASQPFDYPELGPTLFD